MLKLPKWLGNLWSCRSYAKSVKETNTRIEEMKYLNVAEKNDAAKTIAGLLSNGTARRREGYSVYNKVYDFDSNVKGKKCNMIMTSVSGHLMTFEFLQSYRNWKTVNPISLFDAPVRKACPEDFQPIKRTLEREVRGCAGLIIWTDCDREGENIGFEIIKVCRDIKPSITVYRAVFSEITTAAVRRALAQLKEPDKRQNDAVDIRSELDLRTGAAITRFQTMRLQRLFPSKIADKLISYGSCQIPTLGFVAERYKEIEAFVSEAFWKIKVIHTIDDLTVEFNWDRNRLFNKQACEDYFLLCISDPKATVEVVNVKPKSKWRPTPMDTVELEKLGSRKLKLSAKETMTIAEKLYTKGIISYPRTETNQFSKEIDLRSLVEQQTGHNNWGIFATRVLEWGPNPRNGNRSDQAHPPIHPTKLVTNLDGNEARVYELICRHFLACVSKDAVGTETVVKINIAGERFTATGLVILERNYLDVYVYDRWNAKQIHHYIVGQKFDPTEITMPEGATTPPALLTEADLIALMEKHGIGTDATHAEHINTIKERGYIGVIDNGFLVPGVIGMGLYEGYDAMQLALAKPVLRAEFEKDLKKICLGEKDPQAVLQEQIIKYKEAYRQIMDKITAMDEKMALRINETPTATSSGNADSSVDGLQEIFQCPKCTIAPMALKQKKNQSGHFIGCLNFPECKNVVWLPVECQEPSVKDEICPNCGQGYKLMKFKFSNSYYKAIFNTPNGWYKTCLCCDNKFRETFDINLDNVKRVGAIVGTTLTNNTATSSTTNTNSNRNARSDSSGSNIGNSGPSTSSSTATQNSRIKNQPNKTTAQPKREKKSTNINNGSNQNTTSSTTIRNQANKTTAQPKREKKSANINNSSNQNTTSNTTIRNYFSNASTSNQPTDTASVLNDIDDIFNSNDSFDNFFQQDDRNDVAQNENRNPISSDALNIDIEGAFENDFDLDGEAFPTTNQQRNARQTATTTTTEIADQQLSDSFIRMDDSISDVFRTETIDFNNFSWGTASRNSQENEEPNIKRPRFEKSQPISVTTTTQLRSSESSASTSKNYTWGSSERETSTTSSHGVKCSGCHQEAKELSVKKEGPNKGRLFYVCPKEKQYTFFQWADEEAPSTSTNLKKEQTQGSVSWGSSQDSWGSQKSRTSSQGTTSIESTSTSRKSAAQNSAKKSTSAVETVKCNCGTQASSFIVRKDGPNQGRPFYSCPQRSCGFFQWADDNDVQASTSSSTNSNWGSDGRQNSSSSTSANVERESKKRKCGLCRQEGHTKQKCPRKAELDFFS